jgi:hypothetical protein
MAYRIRIKELRHILASELIPNPKNWRTHPKAQREAVKGILSEIGYADALIARETPAGIELLDGHLRAETTPDQKVPVLILDLNDEEADKLLATLDPLAGMAIQDDEALRSLLTDIQFETDILGDLMQELSSEMPDALAEWQNMPEFAQPDATAWKSIPIHFNSLEDLQKFAELIGQPITEQTRSLWFPPAEIQPRKSRRFIVPEDPPLVSQIDVRGIKAMVRADTSDEFIVGEVMDGTHSLSSEGAQE